MRKQIPIIIMILSPLASNAITSKAKSIYLLSASYRPGHNEYAVVLGGAKHL